MLSNINSKRTYHKRINCKINNKKSSSTKNNKLSTTMLCKYNCPPLSISRPVRSFKPKRCKSPSKLSINRDIKLYENKDTYNLISDPENIKIDPVQKLLNYKYAKDNDYVII